MDLVLRFIVGGTVVVLFAALGDVLKPKSFAGLFAAAPSVAIATLGLAIGGEGTPYAAVEARSMIVGAAAFFIYAYVCTYVMTRYRAAAGRTAITGLLLWSAMSLTGWFLVLR